ncbi:MAG TPA: RDD family protein [Actinomycetota bacterium]|nr:RDD family protein [Actinomycetota bacterium]
MTQPPDDLERRPDGSDSDDAVPPEDQPTVAWTPPESPGGPAPDEAPPDEAPPGDAPAGDLPLDDVPPGEAPLTEWTPTQPAPLDVPTPTPPDATQPPPSPIISASPTVPTDPGPAPVPAAPLVGWAAPAPAGAAPGREGYVIAGMGARLVAYFIDGLVVSIIPTILTLVVVDYTDMIQQAIDASRTGGTAAQTSFTFAVTPQLILVALISLALQYLYFIGFWTSGARSTPGMRGLRMQVVDAATGGTLSLLAATKRFIAMGYPLALLILVPALQSAAGVAQFALSLFLFFTAITNDRRQGLHDKWANSLVIRSTTSGDGAVVVGCLVLIAIIAGFAIILFGTVLAAMGPELQDMMRELEQTT